MQPSEEETDKMSAKELKDVFRATEISEGLIYHYRVYLEGRKADIRMRLVAGSFHDTPDGQMFVKGYNEMLEKMSATLWEWNADYDKDTGSLGVDDTESLLKRLNEQKLLLLSLEK